MVIPPPQRLALTEPVPLSSSSCLPQVPSNFLSWEDPTLCLFSICSGAAELLEISDD